MDKYFLFIQTENFCVSDLSAKSIEHLITRQSELNNNDHETQTGEEYFSVVLPFLIKENQDADTPFWFAQWKTNCEGYNLLKEAFSNCHCPIEDDLERDKSLTLASDIIHHLADTLPTPGTFCLEVIWIIKDMPESPDEIVQLHGALARLEVFHNGRIYINAVASDVGEDKVAYKKFTKWQEVLATIKLFRDQLPPSLLSEVFWIGDLKFIGHQGERDLTIADVILSGKESNNFFNIQRYNSERLQLDRKLQILCTVNFSAIPLHVAMTETLTVSFTDEEKLMPLIDICNAMDRQGVCFFGCLWFSLIKEDEGEESFTTEAWTDFIENSNTIHSDMCGNRNKLQNQKMFILHANIENERKLSLTFLQDPKFLDAETLIQLDRHLKSRTRSTNDNRLPEIPSPSQWPEKMAWSNEEFKRTAKGSLVRFQSSEMTLAGIPVPSKDEETDQRTLDELINCFQRDGSPVNNDLKVIPLASDRLLKNICDENTVRGLPFGEAKGFTAHGIEYCLDSQASLKLDSRLMRIQTRYIVDDTRCTCDSSGKEDVRGRKQKERKSKRKSFVEKDDEAMKITRTANINDQGKKRKLSVVEKGEIDKTLAGEGADTTEDIDSNTQQSRSERHKRRLHLIAEAVVQKYGKVDKTNPSFSSCVERLYKLSKSFLKDLRSSKGLTEEMKRVAKMNVQQVVEFELKRKGLDKNC